MGKSDLLGLQFISYACPQISICGFTIVSFCLHALLNSCTKVVFVDNNQCPKFSLILEFQRHQSISKLNIKPE
jgi:hypothetical protein